jgi:hypothetical protein
MFFSRVRGSTCLILTKSFRTDQDLMIADGRPGKQILQSFEEYSTKMSFARIQDVLLVITAADAGSPELKVSDVVMLTYFKYMMLTVSKRLPNKSIESKMEKCQLLFVLKAIR